MVRARSSVTHMCARSQGITGPPVLVLGFEGYESDSVFYGSHDMHLGRVRAVKRPLGEGRVFVTGDVGGQPSHKTVYILLDYLFKTIKICKPVHLCLIDTDAVQELP